MGPGRVNRPPHGEGPLPGGSGPNEALEFLGAEKKVEAHPAIIRRGRRPRLRNGAGGSVKVNPGDEDVFPDPPRAVLRPLEGERPAGFEAALEDLGPPARPGFEEALARDDRRDRETDPAEGDGAGRFVAPVAGIAFDARRLPSVPAGRQIRKMRTQNPFPLSIIAPLPPARLVRAGCCESPREAIIMTASPSSRGGGTA